MSFDDASPLSYLYIFRYTILNLFYFILFFDEETICFSFRNMSFKYQQIVVKGFK